MNEKLKRGDHILIYDSGYENQVWEYLAEHHYAYGIRHDLRNVATDVHWSAVDLENWEYSLLA